MHSNKRYRLCRLSSYWFMFLYHRQKLLEIWRPQRTLKLVRNSPDDQNWVMVHPSAKCPGLIQATFFIRQEPISDILRENFSDIADELVHEGYTKVVDVRD